MSDAPERIWAWEYKGNSPWGPVKPDLDVVKNGAEYIRADRVDALLKAEREKALREAAEVAGVKPRRGGKPVSGPHHAGLRDGREEAKRLVLALISKDDTP